MNSDNGRLLASTFVLAGIGAMVGALISLYVPGHERSNDVVVGFIGGALIGLTLGLFWVRQRRRWIATAVAILLVVFAFAFGGVLYAGIAVATIVITLFASASVLRELYGGNEWEAFRHHMLVWTSRRGGFLIVDGGKIIVPSTAGPHLGPKLVIIRPGNAVIMVSGSRITRVCGPSIFPSHDFEFIEKVLTIQKRRKSLDLRDVLTRDQHPVDVHLTYIYGIGMCDETIQGHNSALKHSDGSCGLTVDELARVKLLAMQGPDWEQDVRAILEGAIRNVIGSQDYGYLLRTSDYLTLADRIQNRARNAIWQAGGDLQSVAVTSVSPRSEVIDAITDAERVRTRDHASGDGFRSAIVSVAAGYRDAANLGMSLEDIHREAARFMMEHLAADPATKIYFGNPGPGVLGDGAASSQGDGKAASPPPTRTP